MTIRKQTIASRHRYSWTFQDVHNKIGEFKQAIRKRQLVVLSYSEDLLTGCYNMTFRITSVQAKAVRRLAERLGMVMRLQKIIFVGKRIASDDWWMDEERCTLDGAVTVRRRPQDFKAYLTTNPGIWEAGDTPSQAIGKLVVTLHGLTPGYPRGF